jgi:molybdopterin molybdotransferase
VYDSNRYTVFGLLSRLGCEVIDLGLVRDDPATLAAALQPRRARGRRHRHQRRRQRRARPTTRATMMQQLGDMAFWRVAMRPGRPLAVGLIPREKAKPQPAAMLFGLPGNPVAVMVTFLAFVRPALLRMMGATSACGPPPLLRPAARSRSARSRAAPNTSAASSGRAGRAARGDAWPATRARACSARWSRRTASWCCITTRAPSPQGDEVDVMMFDGAI